MISQSTIVFLFMVFAYLIFITQRGELPAYLALLYGGGTPTTVPHPQTAGGAGSSPTAPKTSGGPFPTAEGGGLVPPGTGQIVKGAEFAAELFL
jgi:hypothetical protein